MTDAGGAKDGRLIAKVVAVPFFGTHYEMNIVPNGLREVRKRDLPGRPSFARDSNEHE